MTDPIVPKKKGSEIETIFENLKKAEEEEIRVLPESIFYNNFLPFFCGEEVPAQINMGTWIGIAGGPFRPVDIQAASGEIVLRIPPMFEMGGVGVSDRSRFNIHGMLESMTQLQSSFPARAKKYFDEHMAALHITQDATPYIHQYAEQWNKVFARYEKPLLPTTAVVLAEAVKNERPNLVILDDDLL